MNVAVDEKNELEKWEEEKKRINDVIKQLNSEKDEDRRQGYDVLTKIIQGMSYYEDEIISTKTRNILEPLSKDIGILEEADKLIHELVKHRFFKDDEGWRRVVNRLAELLTEKAENQIYAKITSELVIRHLNEIKNFDSWGMIKNRKDVKKAVLVLALSFPPLVGWKEGVVDRLYDFLQNKSNQELIREMDLDYFIIDDVLMPTLLQNKIDAKWLVEAIKTETLLKYANEKLIPNIKESGKIGEKTVLFSIVLLHKLKKDVDEKDDVHLTKVGENVVKNLVKPVLALDEKERSDKLNLLIALRSTMEVFDEQKLKEMGLLQTIKNLLKNNNLAHMVAEEAYLCLSEESLREIYKDAEEKAAEVLTNTEYLDVKKKNRLLHAIAKKFPKQYVEKILDSCRPDEIVEQLAYFDIDTLNNLKANVDDETVNDLIDLFICVNVEKDVLKAAVKNTILKSIKKSDGWSSKIQAFKNAKNLLWELHRVDGHSLIDELVRVIHQADKKQIQKLVEIINKENAYLLAKNLLEKIMWGHFYTYQYQYIIQYPLSSELEKATYLFLSELTDNANVQEHFEHTYILEKYILHAVKHMATTPNLDKDVKSAMETYLKIITMKMPEKMEQIRLMYSYYHADPNLFDEIKWDIDLKKLISGLPQLKFNEIMANIRNNEGTTSDPQSAFKSRNRDKNSKRNKKGERWRN